MDQRNIKNNTTNDKPKVKIDLEKAQYILDWTKTQLYLDTKAEKAKTELFIEEKCIMVILVLELVQKCKKNALA